MSATKITNNVECLFCCETVSPSEITVYHKTNERMCIYCEDSFNARDTVDVILQEACTDYYNESD